MLYINSPTSLHTSYSHTHTTHSSCNIGSSLHMDTLVQMYESSMNNGCIYNHHPGPGPGNHVRVRAHGDDPMPVSNHGLVPSPHSGPNPFDRARTRAHGDDPTPVSNHGPVPSPGDVSESPDHYDSVLRFLNQMLMEEDDLEEKPCMFNDGLALQVRATEKSFYDVLINHRPSGPSSTEDGSHNFSDVGEAADLPPENSSFSSYSRKRSPSREGERDAKQATLLELSSDQTELSEEDLLLCENEPIKKICGPSKRGRPRGKKNTGPGPQETVIDLRNLLAQCAQAITNNDSVSAYEMLRRVKRHSTPHGDSTERLAYYFANAIEARLAGTGVEFYRSLQLRKVSAAEILRAYYSYMMACPFHRMSSIMANGSIEKLSRGKTKVHIVDFGILYGFQWPCFIKKLSTRHGGPPTLRITGIDFPQPGFRPAARVEETGRRLAKYCKRFNVPFEYKGIAKKWDEIGLDELGLEPDGLTVVNSMYRLRNVLDETVVESSPRDTVLRLIRRIEPDVFVHGVLNGTHNAPFLMNRFREALFHFSTLFDVFDNTADRESKHRLLHEQEVFGRDVMNVIACEGASRVERPETYRQWQSRNVRAGFRQVPLWPEKVEEVRAKVRLHYHKDFLVDEDSNWMLQGWKGRVLFAISLWKPV